MGKWHFFQVLLKFKYEDIITASWNTIRLLITTHSLKKDEIDTGHRPYFWAVAWKKGHFGLISYFLAILSFL